MIYKLLLPAIVLAAFGDLMISVGMMALGTEITRMSKWKKRCATECYPSSDETVSNVRVMVDDCRLSTCFLCKGLFFVLLHAGCKRVLSAALNILVLPFRF